MIGQSVGSDASPLSRFLFRPRKSREKRRKRSHTNVSNASVTRTSTPPAQTPQRLFQGAAAGTHATPAPNRAHSGSHAETRAFRTWGGITTLGAFHTFRKPCVARCQNGKLCRFWVLAGCTPEGRRKPAGQRCAYARRCPAGVAAPLGCVTCLQLGDVAVFSLCAQYFLNVRGGGGITTLGAFHTFRKPCVARG